MSNKEELKEILKKHVSYDEAIDIVLEKFPYILRENNKLNSKLELLEDLVQYTDEIQPNIPYIGKFYSVESLIAKHSDVSKERLLELVDLEKSSINIDLIRNKNSPSEVLHKIVNSKLPLFAFEEIIDHPNVSRETLLKLVKDSDYKIKLYIAKKTIDPDVLRELSNSRKLAVKEAVAKNDHAPTDVIEKLLTSKAEKVGRALCRNNNLSYSSLMVLSKKNHVSIGLGLLGRNDLTAEILESIRQTHGDSGHVKKLLLSKPALSEKSLLELASDDGSLIRDKARNHVNATEKVVENADLTDKLHKYMGS